MLWRLKEPIRHLAEEFVRPLGLGGNGLAKQIGSIGRWRQTG